MKKVLSISGVIALAFAAGAANASVIYDWSGTCDTGCTGTATAVLTLEDTYVPGDLLANSDFVSFEFSSDAGSYTVPGDAAFEDFWSGSILPATSGATYTFIDYPGSGTYFTQDLMGAGLWETWIGGSFLASGSGGSWALRTAAVPLPAGLPLMMAGLGAFALIKRRKKA